mmetsp:Transcript_15699/g.28646  ORF Transcript_15699/g.28646 Transcript_15699/m.28646 type:complete len:282 (-) Transcript_15699:536-1381(-)
MAKAYNKFPDETFEESCNHGQSVRVSCTDPICRICFELQSDENALITPCKCTGSVKYIHEECLKAWLLSKQTDLKQVTCELCMSKFGMKFKFELKLAPCSNCDENIAHWFFLPLLISVFTMLVLIVCVIIARIDAVKEEKKFTVVLLITCIVSCLMIVYLFVNSIKEAVFVEELCEWRILSQTPAEKELDITAAPLSQANVMPPRKEIMQVPNKIRIGNKTIRAPVLSSNTLSPVQKGGRVVGYTSRFNSPEHSQQSSQRGGDRFASQSARDQHVVFTDNT